MRDSLSRCFNVSTESLQAVISVCIALLESHTTVINASPEMTLIPTY